MLDLILIGSLDDRKDIKMNKKGRRKINNITQSRWIVRSHKRWLTFHDVYATRKLAEDARKAHQNVGSHTSIKNVGITHSENMNIVCILLRVNIINRK